MARLNTHSPHFTHEGARAAPITPYQELKRSVLACLLWEDTFYETGESITERIKRLAATVNPEQLATLAVSARHDYKLRHVSLLLARELARHAKGNNVGETIAQVISRADELAEFLALYWQEGRQPLSKQVKKGLAAALGKFDEYQLAKYNQQNPIKLRDVLFLVHAKPRDQVQASLWKRLANKQLVAADTWEKRLSAGEDKQQTFTEMLANHSLGYLATLRNLRNMQESGVDKHQVADYLLQHKGIAKVLPFRFIAAARAVPVWEDIIEQAMLKALAGMARLPGKTILLVDRSGSMADKLSAKSDLNRGDAAAALAILLRGVCEEIEIWWFTGGSAFWGKGKWLQPLPPRHGMALADLLKPRNEGTDLGGAVEEMVMHKYDRFIVITDEQSSSKVPNPRQGRNYMINVAPYRHGVGYGAWTHIDGFSEAVVTYIQEIEALSTS